jgi:hypothetical protein
MTKRLKTTDVIVVTTDKWAGTVEATSRTTARQLAEDHFNEGLFQQCDEEIHHVEIKEVRP